MNTGKYVFSQVVNFLDPNEFNRFVIKYNGNHKVKHFSCWNQLMCMLFGQLSNRDSISDLICCLNTQRSRWYHLGLGKGLSKSNLTHANCNRDWRIFAEFAYSLIEKARLTCTSGDFYKDIKGSVYAIDSTTIELCLSVFWWARCRKDQAAIKVHTQFDLKTSIASFIHISDGSLHDLYFLDIIDAEVGSLYVLDRGYMDFKRLWLINKSQAFFITRLKKGISYKRRYSHPYDPNSGVKCDQTIKLSGEKSSRDYPGPARRISYFDKESNKRLEFLTNNFELSSYEIAQLYKQRWQIELFFKWIKQHLKVKTFWGHSFNAVRIQIYTALTAYTLVAIIKQKLKINYSNYEILQILSLTLLNKTQLNQLFDDAQLQESKQSDHNQMILFNLY